MNIKPFFLFISIISIANAQSLQKIQTIQAKNVEIHIGQQSSETLSADRLTIVSEGANMDAINQTMTAKRKNNWLHLQNEQYEIFLPFLTQTVLNESNTYHFYQLNLDFETQRFFRINFKNAKIQLKKALFLLNNLNLSCQKRFNTKTSTTLMRCLEDEASAQLSTISMDSISTNFLHNLLTLKPLRRQRAHGSTQHGKLKDAVLSIYKNQFELDTEYDGKSIYLNGTVVYVPAQSQLKIFVAEATYFWFSVRSRIYKKLRSIQSDYLNVDQNDVINIKFDQF